MSRGWSNFNEVWLVEAKDPGGKYQPFCGCVGCKSKSHAEDMMKEMKVRKPLLGACTFRVALYRRVKK